MIHSGIFVVDLLGDNLWLHSGMKDGLPVFAVCPTSATNAAPVTNDARSEARNSTTFAISSGLPRRPMGITFLNLSANPGCSSAGANNGVSIAPGQMQLARIP